MMGRPSVVLFVGLPGSQRCCRPAGTVQKWEYNIKQLTRRQADLVTKLNELGQQGWEWVEIVPVDSTDLTAQALKDIHVLFRHSKS